MKKVLAIVLVLMAAQIAGAAFIFWDVEQLGGNEYGIKLMYSDNQPVSGGYFEYNSATIERVEIKRFDSDNAGGVISTVSWYAGFNNSQDIGSPGSASYLVNATTGTLNPRNAIYGRASAGSYIVATGEIELASFTYTGDVGDIITLGSAADGSFIRDVGRSVPGWQEFRIDGTDIGTITIIPEPMTLALLGFGGLFIKRRRV